jgi:hypothetical protein
MIPADFFEIPSPLSTAGFDSDDLQLAVNNLMKLTFVKQITPFTDGRTLGIVPVKSGGSLCGRGIYAIACGFINAPRQPGDRLGKACLKPGAGITCASIRGAMLAARALMPSENHMRIFEKIFVHVERRIFTVGGDRLADIDPPCITRPLALPTSIHRVSPGPSPSRRRRKSNTSTTTSVPASLRKARSGSRIAPTRSATPAIRLRAVVSNLSMVQRETTNAAKASRSANGKLWSHFKVRVAPVS